MQPRGAPVVAGGRRECWTLPHGEGGAVGGRRWGRRAQSSCPHWVRRGRLHLAVEVARVETERLHLLGHLLLHLGRVGHHHRLLAGQSSGGAGAAARPYRNRGHPLEHRVGAAIGLRLGLRVVGRKRRRRGGAAWRGGRRTRLMTAGGGQGRGIRGGGVLAADRWVCGGLVRVAGREGGGSAPQSGTLTPETLVTHNSHFTLANLSI